jgi:hypothetical protein
MTEPPDVLVDAIRLALADVDDRHQLTSLQVYEADEIDEPDEMSDQRPGVEEWWIEGDPGGFRMTIGPAGLSEAVAGAAERFQEHLGDDADPASWGPFCAVHDHPAVARCVAGEARWCCPRGPEVWSAPIGTLGTPPQIEVITSGPTIKLNMHWPD